MKKANGSVYLSVEDRLLEKILASFASKVLKAPTFRSKGVSEIIDVLKVERELFVKVQRLGENLFFRQEDKIEGKNVAKH